MGSIPARQGIETDSYRVDVGLVTPQGSIRIGNRRASASDSLRPPVQALLGRNVLRFGTLTLHKEGRFEFVVG